MAYNPALEVSSAIVLPLLGILTIALRFYVRLKMRPNPVGWDDILIVGAAIFLVGMAATQIVGTFVAGNGHDDLTDTDPRSGPRGYNQAKINYIMVIVEKPCYGFVKLSVLLFYRRVFGAASRTFRIANHLLLALVTAWLLAFFWVEVFVCGLHPALQWHDPAQCQSTYSHSTMLFWFGITDIISDAAILVVPYPVIHRLQRPGLERWGIAAIFALGWLCVPPSPPRPRRPLTAAPSSVAAGIVRMVFVANGVRIDQAAAAHHRASPLPSPPPVSFFRLNPAQNPSPTTPRPASGRSSSSASPSSPPTCPPSGPSCARRPIRTVSPPPPAASCPAPARASRAPRPRRMRAAARRPTAATRTRAATGTWNSHWQSRWARSTAVARRRARLGSGCATGAPRYSGRSRLLRRRRWNEAHVMIFDC